MLTIKQTFSLLTLLGVAGLSTLPSASASSAQSTKLRPCGGSGKDAPTYSFEVDSNCRRISDLGAFMVDQVGNYPEGVEVGFSAYADCKKSYVPDEGQWSKWSADQGCNVVHMAASKDNGGGTDKNYKGETFMPYVMLVNTKDVK